MACEPAHAIRLVKDGDIFYRQFDMRFLSAHNDLDGVRPEDRQNFSHLIPLRHGPLPAHPLPLTFSEEYNNQPTIAQPTSH